MKRRNQFYAITMMMVLLLSGKAQAQNQISKNDNGDSLTVTASAANQQVRFTAPVSVVQIRLEVYNANGRKLFDNELRGGNVLDWHLLDGQAEPLADDTYLCVVTIKSLSGKLTQRIGSVRVEQSQVSLQATASLQMTPQQLETVGAVEENTSLTILEVDQKQTTTVMAHDGEDGQITRGKGALSFRLGDFYSGKDEEQMRLTADGNLGIGTSNPQTKLDVNGLIRTTQGIVFPDGTIQTTAAFANQSYQKSGEKPEGSIAKLGKSGKMGKSGKDDKDVSPQLNVNEDLTINGNIIFTPPVSVNFRDITMQDNNSGLRFYGAPFPLTASPVAAAIQFWGNNSFFQGQMYLDSGAHNNAAVILRTTVTGGTITERMRVTATGNVGIGTNNPGALLDVAGTVNTASEYRIRGNRALSIAGTNNIFAGEGAGGANTGSDNAFYGAFAGTSSTTGSANSFFGTSAGFNTTTGSNNTFFGRSSGFQNNAGSNNAFFGRGAGRDNQSDGNSFFGHQAGLSNSTGNFNAFFGKDAGLVNTMGSSNAFFGQEAGANNTTGGSNAFFGTFAGFSNSTGRNNIFIGESAGATNSTGNFNTFIGFEAGNANSTGNNNASFGLEAGNGNSTGSNNTFIGVNANPASGNLDHATAIGADALVSSDNTIVLGRALTDNVVASNRMQVRSIPLLPSFASVCFNAAGDLLQCGASSLRFKTEVQSFGDGLNIVRLLRPIRFTWKANGQSDIGLGAEEVAQVAPSFVYTNSKGEIEGVKYDRLNVVFINAIKEQQTQIEQQRTLIQRQQTQVSMLCERLLIIEKRLLRRGSHRPTGIRGKRS